MAVTVTKAVWKRSASRGMDRLVLLCLADHVIEEKLKNGHPPEAWPSQNTIAKMCGCARSTVQLSLERLQELGEIEDTGERKHGRYRGAVVYEILLDLTDCESGDGHDLTDSESTRDDLTDCRSSGESQNGDLTDLDDDLTDSEPDLTDSRADLTDGSVTNQYETSKKPETKARVAAATVERDPPDFGVEKTDNGEHVEDDDDSLDALRRRLIEAEAEGSQKDINHARAELASWSEPVDA